MVAGALLSGIMASGIADEHSKEIFSPFKRLHKDGDKNIRERGWGFRHAKRLLNGMMEDLVSVQCWTGDEILLHAYALGKGGLKTAKPNLSLVMS